MAWHVYLLACADGTLYCGVTTDLDRRLQAHNGAVPGGAAYTRGRRPVALLAAAPCPDRASACRLEIKIKKLPRKEKLAFLKARAATDVAEVSPSGAPEPAG